MTNKVHIEVMIDTNANSRKIDGEFKEVREGVEGGGDASASRTLREFRSYLSAARRMTGVDYEVTQRDTAQIYHEKTNTFTPDLAREAGITIMPDFLRENLESGFYHVEPPVHGEEIYYAALRRMVYLIQEDKTPGKLKSEGIGKPEDIGLLRLQAMYREHMMPLPQNSKYRTKPPFEKEFKRYHKVRFNQGEETAITFLRNHPLPAAGERTAFVFVGSDQYANESMATARKGKEAQDNGRMDVFVTGPKQFRRMLAQVVRSIEAEHPQCRVLREDLPQLKGIEQELLPPSSGRAAYRVPERKVKAFADFVTQGVSTAQGRG